MSEYTFTFQPKGPFDLRFQNQFFNGWPTLATDEETIVMAFPVEGWQTSAAVTLRQADDGMLYGCVYGVQEKQQALAAQAQALAAMSLDVDGSRWLEVGKQDPHIGELQTYYHGMRPTLFHSPYEAACAFVIGHRIHIAQTRKLRAKMAEQYGKKIMVEGEAFFAFPEPENLLKLEEFPGIALAKIPHLHAIARAALDGWLQRAALRTIEPEAALEKLQTLPGVGPFFAQGILYRGVGVSDGITSDDISQYAVRRRYGLPESSSFDEILKVAEAWRPYRMWALVLMHVWQREHNDLPKKKFSRS